MNKEEFIYIEIRNSVLKYFSFYIVYVITANRIFEYIGGAYLIYVVFKIIEIIIIAIIDMEKISEKD
ncbi:hypothetical protein JCM1393_15380 [Clostridium carnis]